MAITLSDVVYVFLAIVFVFVIVGILQGIFGKPKK